MKKLSLEYLFERIQKIEKEYIKKPKTYHVMLNNILEKEAIDDLKKLGWKEIKTNIQERPLFSINNEAYTQLEKKEYENE